MKKIFKTREELEEFFKGSSVLDPLDNGYSVTMSLTFCRMGR